MRKTVTGILLLVLSAVPLIGQCTTPYNYVYCTNCPGGTLNYCWQSQQVSYAVFGTVDETWCNWTFGSGWSNNYDFCTTVSSISTSVDCNGNRYAQQGQICCIEW